MHNFPRAVRTHVSVKFQTYYLKRNPRDYGITRSNRSQKMSFYMLIGIRDCSIEIKQIWKD